MELASWMIHEEERDEEEKGSYTKKLMKPYGLEKS